ncbi:MULTISPECIES: lactonase family protein [unclassified Sphingomonas]|uniref:lactonase family protein n=1 Tax=unclassified Sphingomonas TaxID=196159 RepID=UPI0021514084|nr:MULTISPECIES: lactonase family protein [unclassified Sphingomonas]MCR5872545.1 lactonase family protein [Sphingomonas sp. J344]UUX99171.1 lactonase family protein [Sphingomonas sp. J315]
MTSSPFAPSRRAFVAGSLVLASSPAAAVSRKPDRLIAGTYASRKGPGLVPMIATPEGWTAQAPLDAIRNASFGVRAPNGVRYLLEEQTEGKLGIYGAAMQLLGSVSTLGADPCHAALSPDGRTLAIANYSSGSVTLWRLDGKTGLPVGEAQKIAHQGSGPNQRRQTEPHAHWVGFAQGGRVLHAVDLGADAVFAHRVNLATGRVTESTTAYRAAPGSGPRHLAWHPRLPIAYLFAELANTVTLLRADRDGSFTGGETLATLPAGFDGPSSGAHIAVNRAGTRLYLSNRGHDSIAVFAIARDGGPSLLQHVSCGGHWPRLFLLREDRGELLVANERSGNVAVLRVQQNGKLGKPIRGVEIPGVAFLSE